jgi:hypothetical protein
MQCKLMLYKSTIMHNKCIYVFRARLWRGSLISVHMFNFPLNLFRINSSGGGEQTCTLNLVRLHIHPHQYTKCMRYFKFLWVGWDCVHLDWKNSTGKSSLNIFRMETARGRKQSENTEWCNKVHITKTGCKDMNRNEETTSISRI